MSEQLNHFSSLIGRIWAEYKGHFTRIEVPAKTDLLKEGDIAQKMFFIETGCVRVWHNHDGRDITCQFFFEGNMVSSIESFKKDIVSPITIQTIEAGIIWWIDKKEMKKIIEEMKEHPQLRDMLIDALFERTFDYIRHFTTYILNTPEQR